MSSLSAKVSSNKTCLANEVETTKVGVGIPNFLDPKFQLP
jgi:hypothetical protein